MNKNVNRRGVLAHGFVWLFVATIRSLRLFLVQLREGSFMPSSFFYLF
ncbi:hypothetical protein [uncultured Bartonella sp.]|nr:hypothetical protein [uncultured Bartonella sp.]